MNTLKKEAVYNGPEHRTYRKIVVTSGSPDGLKRRYNSKLVQLEHALDQLTLLENPCEIESICRQIIIIKNRMQKILAG